MYVCRYVGMYVCIYACMYEALTPVQALLFRNTHFHPPNTKRSESKPYH